MMTVDSRDHTDMIQIWQLSWATTIKLLLKMQACQVSNGSSQPQVERD